MTRREAEVLAALGDRLTNAEIAQLGVEPLARWRGRDRGRGGGAAADRGRAVDRGARVGCPRHLAGMTMGLMVPAAPALTRQIVRPRTDELVDMFMPEAARQTRRMARQSVSQLEWLTAAIVVRR